MLLCYHGTYTFRIRQAVSDLLDSTRTRTGTSLNVVSVDCAQDGAGDDIERVLKYPSFFGDSTVILATHAAGEVMADILERFPVSSMPDIILVAVQDTSLKTCSKKVLASLVRAADTAVQFMPLSGDAQHAWAHAYCRTLGATIAQDALRLLTERTGSDTGLLAMELGKLAAYAGDAEISSDTVRLLTAARPERDEWELSNAMAAHDKRAAITALWRRLQEGAPEQLLIGSLAAGLRNLLIIKDLSSRKQNPAGIARLTGLHPFVVSKTLKGTAAADAERLRTAHISLARLERDAKEGLADMTDGMFSVLLSL